MTIWKIPITLFKTVAKRIVPLRLRRAIRKRIARLRAKPWKRYPLCPTVQAGHIHYPDRFIFASRAPRQSALFAEDQHQRNYFFFADADFPTEELNRAPLQMVIPRALATLPTAEAIAWIEQFAHHQSIEDPLCIVQDAQWRDLARGLNEKFNWRTVFADPASPPDLTKLYGNAAIIIVSYNGLELIRQCVESILNRTIYPDYKIIIVDNASIPPVKTYLAELAQREPRVHVIFNATNLGFAAANNLGLRAARDSEFVVLLNNDTVVPRGWLCRLIRHLRNPAIGMVGPVTNWTGNAARIDVDYDDLAQMEEFARAYTYAHEGVIFEMDMLAMFCVAMRQSVAAAIGQLDERFGLGMFEDEDYARRVRQAGYRVICARDAFIHHHGMASFSKLDDAAYRALFERNKRLFEEKWGERWIPFDSRTPSVLTHTKGD